MLPPYKTSAALQHLLSPAAANHTVDIWEVAMLMVFKWNTAWAIQYEWRPWKSKAEATSELCKKPNVIRGDMSLAGGAVLTDFTTVLFITYYSYGNQDLHANGAYKFRMWRKTTIIFQFSLSSLNFMSVVLHESYSLLSRALLSLTALFYHTVFISSV